MTYLMQKMILTLIIAGIIEKARSICVRNYSSTTPASYVKKVPAGTSTSSSGSETSSSTVTRSTTTITTARNWLNSSTVLSSTEQSNLYTMLPSYTAGVLLYKATRDGFMVKAFHDRCDNASNTVTIIRNNLNFIFGGFTAASWNSTAGYIADPTAFIFSLSRNGVSNNHKLMIGFTEVGFAILSHPTLGPTFGSGNDIRIIDQSDIVAGSYSIIQSYTPPTYPSGSDDQTFLTGGYLNWLATEIEVYQLFK